MGNFRQDRGSRGGFGDRRRSGGFGGRGNFNRDRGERFERRPAEMFDATCSKCGKACQVPFKPTGSRPVLCSDCFRNNDSREFSSRSDSQSGAGASQEQFDQINAKLDKIIQVLQELEIDTGDEFEDDTEDTDDEDESN